MTVRARVVLTLEIVAHSHWGLEVTAEQVHKQALDDVKQAMRLGLAPTARLRNIERQRAGLKAGLKAAGMGDGDTISRRASAAPRL